MSSGLCIVIPRFSEVLVALGSDSVLRVLDTRTQRLTAFCTPNYHMNCSDCLEAPAVTLLR